MTVGILKEKNDSRVSLVPGNIKKLRKEGFDILLQKSAGESSYFTDADYTEVPLAERSEVLEKSDIIFSIHPPTSEELDKAKQEAVFVGIYEPLNYPEVTEHFTKKSFRVFSLDMVPRTTLAQSMDVLSSMASLAGYRAVLLAASHLPRYFPMLITAAGSIRPAKVLVLGAGVAGLQAIATAKRLGAITEAFDVRKAAKEEVESLGAKFIEVEGAAEDTGAGGYAVEQSEEYLQRQRAEVQNRAAAADVIITTAQVRGRKAPVLVPEETVKRMKRGSVIIDLAASATGGNCALSEDKKTLVRHGVTIIGDSNLPSGIPQDAATLISNNFINFLKFISKEGKLMIDKDNEIVKGALIVDQQNEE